MAAEDPPVVLREAQLADEVLLCGSELIRVNVRFIAATNKNLKALVERGSSARALTTWLNSARLHVPPLARGL